MLRVKTKLKHSKIHEIGLFADQFIPKGTVTWIYDPHFDTSFTEEDLEKLPELSRNFILYYTYFDTELNKFVLCCDNQRHINHTHDQNKENIISTPKQDMAARDINIGEELLCDYRKFDESYFERLSLDFENLV